MLLQPQTIINAGNSIRIVLVGILEDMIGSMTVFTAICGVSNLRVSCKMSLVFERR